LIGGAYVPNFVHSNSSFRPWGKKKPRLHKNVQPGKKLFDLAKTFFAEIGKELL
jgi:hypothetical protein